MAIDPGFLFAEALEGVAAPLPLFLVVDAATMRVEGETIVLGPEPARAIAERVRGSRALVVVGGDGTVHAAIEPALEGSPTRAHATRYNSASREP